MDHEPFEDNRKQKRFKAVEGAVASFPAADAASSGVLGEIIDINMSGLSLHYKSRDQLGSVTSVTIFAYRDPFINIEEIPCRIVYDMGLDATSRRCGLEFLDLSQGQVLKLQELITHYTSGEV
jgi:hypothetical protein